MEYAQLTILINLNFFVNISIYQNWLQNFETEQEEISSTTAKKKIETITKTIVNLV